MMQILKVWLVLYLLIYFLDLDPLDPFLLILDCDDDRLLFPIQSKRLFEFLVGTFESHLVVV